MWHDITVDTRWCGICSHTANFVFFFFFSPKNSSKFFPLLSQTKAFIFPLTFATITTRVFASTARATFRTFVHAAAVSCKRKTSISLASHVSERGGERNINISFGSGNLQVVCVDENENPRDGEQAVQRQHPQQSQAQLLVFG